MDHQSPAPEGFHHELFLFFLMCGFVMRMEAQSLASTLTVNSLRSKRSRGSALQAGCYSNEQMNTRVAQFRQCKPCRAVKVTVVLLAHGTRSAIPVAGV
jgi:hypothetical protein